MGEIEPIVKLVRVIHLAAVRNISERETERENA
jgi:hypothetical protein